MLRCLLALKYRKLISSDNYIPIVFVQISILYILNEHMTSLQMGHRDLVQFDPMFTANVSKHSGWPVDHFYLLNTRPDMDSLWYPQIYYTLGTIVIKIFVTDMKPQIKLGQCPLYRSVWTDITLNILVAKCRIAVLQFYTELPIYGIEFFWKYSA